MRPIVGIGIARLGRMVRHARRRIGLSQSTLARRTGVGTRFISDLENGKPTLQIHKVLQVLMQLGLSWSVSEPDKETRIIPDRE